MIYKCIHANTIIYCNSLYYLAGRPEGTRVADPVTFDISNFEIKDLEIIKYNVYTCNNNSDTSITK